MNEILNCLIPSVYRQFIHMIFQIKYSLPFCKQFEIQSNLIIPILFQNPSLFKGCHFFLDIPNKEEINYDEMLLTKFNLIKLVKAGDGVILGREPRFEDSANLPPPHHLLNKEDHPLYRCTHFIIYVPAIRKSSNKEKIIYNSATLKSLPLKWFIESITKFELLDPAEVGADNSFTNQI